MGIWTPYVLSETVTQQQFRRTSHKYFEQMLYSTRILYL
jgi:hypothetical protein